MKKKVNKHGKRFLNVSRKMDTTPLYQGNSIFRNQPPYTFFNKTFEEAKDALFLQIEEINPNFLTDEQLNDTTGFSQNILVDPRTKKEQIKTEYDHSLKGKRQKVFKGGGIKSALTKAQHKVGLRVLLAQQERKELEEADLIIWHRFQRKLQKERKQMLEYIREFEETHKEEIYEPTKRLDELYRDWFSKKRESYIKNQPENLTFNTHTGLPLVNLCKTINDDPIEIIDVELLSKQGFVRVYQGDDELDWQNLNFRLHDFAQSFNENVETEEKAQLKEKINAELESNDEKCNGQSFYIPFKTLLFLFTAGEIDLPTEVLLEIKNCNSKMDDKIITFEMPLPAHNCGYHTHQQMVEQCFDAFMSAKGRAKWLEINDGELHCEHENLNETDFGGTRAAQYSPLKFEDFLVKNQAFYKIDAVERVKENTALLKWYLKGNDSEYGLKILTTLKLPPVTSGEADEYIAFEFLKLQSKPQFGCELFTKHELLNAWLQMRLMSFISRTDFGICYHLSMNDLSLQLKQRLTLEQLEQALKQNYRINPNELMTNLFEFLRLLCNMPIGKYLLRYNPKYSDKFLLCMTSKEIAQSTVFLHGLFEAVPTNLAWMTQKYFLPISETTCSAVHLDYTILPCAFLPLLPGQKNVETADIKMKRRKNFMAKIADQNLNIKEKQLKVHKRVQKRKWRRSKANGAKVAKVSSVEKSNEEIFV